MCGCAGGTGVGLRAAGGCAGLWCPVRAASSPLAHGLVGCGRFLLCCAVLRCGAWLCVCTYIWIVPIYPPRIGTPIAWPCLWGSSCVVDFSVCGNCSAQEHETGTPGPGSAPYPWVADMGTFWIPATGHVRNPLAELFASRVRGFQRKAVTCGNVRSAPEGEVKIN